MSDNISSQKQMDMLVQSFWNAKPYIKDVTKNHELEVRFGTRNVKPITKIDYDNVIRKLRSLGFTTSNDDGSYLLRIQNEFLDSSTGKFKTSNIRTEINGFHGIQEYCKHNDLKKMISKNNPGYTIQFQKKGPFLENSREKKNDRVSTIVNNDEFNFRISHQLEENLSSTSGIIRSTLENWMNSKKIFRYLNRVTFTHKDIPVQVDLSIVKSSKYVNRRPELASTTEESGVFSNPEVYEIELEIDNSRIGPGTDFQNVDSLLTAIRKTIKYVLMGLQGTNYPISYVEQKEILGSYMKLLHGKDYNPEKRVYPSDFMGPSSYTLQVKNIMPVNEDAKIPNIRKDFVVTEKADGERHLLYINPKGKIYLINTNMSVIFTGTETQNKDLVNSLLDGEIIYHDKYGKFIYLYAAFDIYYLNGEDVRALEFIQKKQSTTVSRLSKLKKVIKECNLQSVTKTSSQNLITQFRIECKKFYPTGNNENIFASCGSILERADQGLFEYNTDGLIFTHTSFGVGGDEIGKSGPLYKKTWDYSFKWKPPKYNTIDFLVTTVKNEKGLDRVTPVFEDGLNVESVTQLNEYKTIELRCGFDERKHGFLNPCQDVIEDKLPSANSTANAEYEEHYKPVVFSPTNPADPNAGITNIMLKNGQMFTEEEQQFGDNTIVECSYELDADKGWRWKPLRVRYDKTGELRQGLKNFGNAYHVANSNWHSIHNPITKEMISTGEGIPEELDDDDIYYNRVLTNKKESGTAGLRDFHNLYVKKLLITSVSKRNDNLIDYACGKGGDFPKWIEAKMSFVFGIDVSKDNLENRVDGACARFLNYRKDFKVMPYALFVNGNSGVNIRSGSAMLNDKAMQITRAVFGQGARDEEKLGKGVVRQYGKGEDGFDISSCQFAIHYFFENQTSFHNFVRNVAECTKLGGYFIGTSYDGKKIFQLLKGKKRGESIDIYQNKTKIWEIRKEYDENEFDDDASSLGFQIDVYQESINKMFAEYLVNYDYLARVMENYGFRLITREEAKELGLQEGSGMFSELYQMLQEEVKKNQSKKYRVGDALKMTPNEKKISFLNRYFVYKKIRHVNAEKVALDLHDEIVESTKMKKGKDDKTLKKMEKVEKTEKVKKPVVRKLNKKLVLETATKSVEELPVESEVINQEKKNKLLDEEKVDEEKVDEEKVGEEKVDEEKVGEEKVNEENVDEEKAEKKVNEKSKKTKEKATKISKLKLKLEE